MTILFLSFSFLLISLTSAAPGLHLNFFLGTSNYQGDLQDKIYSFNQAHLAGGIGFSYDLSNRFSVRADFKIGKISADDEKGRNKARNLNFASQLTEGDIDLQYFITTLGQHTLTPYVFAGIGLYHFDPYTFDSTGQKYYLKPFSTEGEGFATGIKEYNLTQVSIPFGAGVKMPLSDNINVGLEVGFRKLFTDYLDDVSGTFIDENLLLANRGSKAVELAYRGGEIKGGSPVYPAAGTQRGNSKLKDWYYFTGLTLSFRLLNGNLGGSGKEISCPKNVL
jgi:opacity protein-like surface antigen